MENSTAEGNVLELGVQKVRLIFFTSNYRALLHVGGRGALLDIWSLFYRLLFSEESSRTAKFADAICTPV